MSNSSDTPWWQIIGTIAGAVGLAYLNHVVTESQVDALLRQDDNEAAEKIITLAVQASDSSWSHFRILLKNRAAMGGRAAHLLRFADQMRSVGLNVNQLITADPEQVVQFALNTVPVLDQGTWAIVQHMLTIRAESEERARGILHLLRRVRHNVEEINQLVQLNPAYAGQLLEGMLYSMDQTDRAIFVGVLQARARSQPDIRVRALLGQVQRNLGY